MSNPESDFSHLAAVNDWQQHIRESIPPGSWFESSRILWRSAAGLAELDPSGETRPLIVPEFSPAYFIRSRQRLEDLGCFSLLVSERLGSAPRLRVEAYARTIVDTWELTPEGVGEAAHDVALVLAKVSICFPGNRQSKPFLSEAYTSPSCAALALHLLGVFEPPTALGTVTSY